MEKINELDFYKLIFEKYKEKEKFFVIAYYQDVEKIKRIFHYEKIISLRNFEKIVPERLILKNNIETFYGTTLLYENLLDKNLEDEILFFDFCNKKGANIIFLVNKLFSEKFKKFHDYFFIDEHIIFTDTLPVIEIRGFHCLCGLNKIYPGFLLIPLNLAISTS